MERIRYAPQIATANTAASSGSTENSGRNARQSTAAIGTQTATTTTFIPAKEARSWWIGWIGCSSIPDSSPRRMRSSQPYGVNTMFIVRTSVQTM
jgi:hypothetical protein